MNLEEKYPDLATSILKPVDSEPLENAPKIIEPKETPEELLDSESEEIQNFERISSEEKERGEGEMEGGNGGKSGEKIGEKSGDLGENEGIKVEDSTDVVEAREERQGEYEEALERAMRLSLEEASRRSEEENGVETSVEASGMNSLELEKETKEKESSSEGKEGEKLEEIEVDNEEVKNGDFLKPF